MKTDRFELEIRLLRRILYGAEHRKREAGGVVPQPFIVVGRVVRSLTYGKGFIAEMEGSAVTVRFWKGGFKRFYPIEGKYPFDSIDEVRPIKEKSEVERVLARETSAEKRERKYRSQHGEFRVLCLRCDGLLEGEITKWSKHRTTERKIKRTGDLKLKRYIPVKISRRDCSLISRPPSAVPASKISYWYQCAKCYATYKVAEGEARLNESLCCHAAVIPIAEPFQKAQFSPLIGIGGRQWEDDANTDGETVSSRPHSQEVVTAIGLFVDPNSRVQAGGTGYLRIPLDASRETRASAPQWINHREDFIRSLRESRAVRAERILSEFYHEGKTDSQIAEAVGWNKHSLKKERAMLIKEADEFFNFRTDKYPPSPAISEDGESTQIHTRTPRFSPPCPAIGGGRMNTCALAKPAALPIVPTHSMAVCSPASDTLHLYPVFDYRGQRFAKTGKYYQRVSSLKGFLREEPKCPRDRKHAQTEVSDDEMSE